MTLSLASCNGNRPDNNVCGHVDVEKALENQGEVTTSQLGKRIRFIPLETGDNSLIADKWRMKVTDRYALISNTDRIITANTNADIMSFDLNTGRFVSQIGSRGQGPEDYLFPIAHLDAVNDFTYFTAGNGKGWVR